MSNQLASTMLPMNKVNLDETAKAFHIPNWKDYDDHQRMAFLRKVAQEGGRDPRIATLCIKIFKDNDVRVRDYKGQAAAILKWVQEHMYYINEPGERLQDPIYTLRTGYGDCLPKDTYLLRDDYELVKISEIKNGDKIWGKDKFTRVINVWSTGRKKITNINLNNGSTLKATENHNVFVYSCSRHGMNCPDFYTRSSNCSKLKKNIVELRVSELKAGMRMLKPELIDSGTLHEDPDISFINGLYVADGYMSHKYEKSDGSISSYDFSISALKGGKKDKNRDFIEDFCKRNSLNYRLENKSIVVKSTDWATYLLKCGNVAKDKRVPSLNLNVESISRMLDGVLADSGISQSGSTVFGTTSKILALQFRIMNLILGKSCSMIFVENHGGLGENPIFRMTPYKERRNGIDSLKITSIEREVYEDDCYDMTTEDHYIYLPESDCVVHNCDDLAILLAAMYESIRLPFRYVLSGKNRVTKEVDRWIEGTPMKPIEFSHIYVVVGDRPFGKPKWHYAEPTLKGVSLGWDVVKHHRYNGNAALPELAGSDNMMEKHKLTLPLPMKNEILSFMNWTEEDLNLHPKAIWHDVKRSITPRKIIVGLIAGIIIGATVDKLLYETGIVKKPKTRYEHDKDRDSSDYDSNSNEG